MNGMFDTPRKLTLLCASIKTKIRNTTPSTTTIATVNISINFIFHARSLPSICQYLCLDK